MLDYTTLDYTTLVTYAEASDELPQELYRYAWSVPERLLPRDGRSTVKQPLALFLVVLSILGTFRMQALSA